MKLFFFGLQPVYLLVYKIGNHTTVRRDASGFPEEPKVQSAADTAEKLSGKSILTRWTSGEPTEGYRRDNSLR